jgi:hypothetical protein
MQQAKQMVLDNEIIFEKSKYVVKSIDEFKLTLYYRSHKMGSPEAVIPEVIRPNKRDLDFPQPPQSNKCLMFDHHPLAVPPRFNVNTHHQRVHIQGCTHASQCLAELGRVVNFLAQLSKFSNRGVDDWAYRQTVFYSQ